MYVVVFFFFFKQKTAYEMRISDWSSDVCSSDLSFFPKPAYRPVEQVGTDLAAQAAQEPAFAAWIKRNLAPHRQPGYHAVFVSLKAHGEVAGDVSSEQYEALADLTETFGFGELRSTFDQNLVMPDVAECDLYPLWQRLKALNMATPNIGLLTDMICCPGLDFCGLANASSISVYHDIYDRFESLDDQYDVGPIRITMSGCMNGCGHHSVGHIGILGVDKSGEEWYQVMLGGTPADGPTVRSEEHTSELQSLMRISYAVFCLKKKKNKQ